MAIFWDDYNVKGTVTTSGGKAISLASDVKSQDYSILTVDGVQYKLSEQDLRDIVALIQREAFPRLGVKNAP